MLAHSVKFLRRVQVKETHSTPPRTRASETTQEYYGCYYCSHAHPKTIGSHSFHYFYYVCDLVPISKSLACNSTTERSHSKPQHFIVVHLDLRTKLNIIPKQAPAAAIAPEINMNCSDPLNPLFSSIYKVSTENNRLYAFSYLSSSALLGFVTGGFLALGSLTSISESELLSS